jgi:hypothetical protein
VVATVAVMDDRASGICARYLEIADRRAPGAVEGLYLHGSVALGDYRHGVSDIDFVAVTGRPLDTGRRGGPEPTDITLETFGRDILEGLRMRPAKFGGLQVARIGLGAMGMSHGYTGAGSDDAESIRTIHRSPGGQE